MSYQDQSIERKFEVAGSSAPKKISKIQFGNEHSFLQLPMLFTVLHNREMTPATDENWWNLHRVNGHEVRVVLSAY